MSDTRALRSAPMAHEERNALIATLGLIIAAVGTFLPWARIGGRNRSGYETADTFIGIADGALPDQIAWIGRWWYLPAFCVLVAWGSSFFRGTRPLRLVAVLLTALALTMWWLFTWAGENYNVLDSQLVGPIVTTVGAIVIALACSRRRSSIVRPDRQTGSTSATGST